jgi:hypothetical protein
MAGTPIIAKYRLDQSRRDWSDRHINLRRTSSSCTDLGTPLAQTGIPFTQSYPQEEDKTDDQQIHGQQLEDKGQVL